MKDKKEDPCADGCPRGCVHDRSTKKFPELSYQDQKKQRLVKELASFLVKNQAGKGIAISMPSGVIPWALEWAAVRQQTNLQGYPTQEEAEAILAEQLGVNMEGA